MTMTPRKSPTRMHALRPWLLGLVCTPLLLPPALAQPAPGPERARTARAPAAAPQPARVTVNFVNADLEAVTRAIAAMLNRPILVDPRVRGTITVFSEQPMTVNNAFLTYQTALRGLGFAVVESAGLLKVVPEADAKLQTGTVSVGAGGPGPIRGDQVITQIFTLRHENPNNLVAVLRPLISANNTINAAPGSNALVITDYADNLRRLGQIIAALDVPSASDVEVIPLRHAVASDIAPLVQRLADGGSSGPVQVPGAGIGGGLTVLADPRGNALIVRAANPARLAAVRATIARLDQPSPDGQGMWVVHLKNADAARLATVLRAAFAANAPGSGLGGGGGGPIQAAASILPGLTGQSGSAQGNAAATTPVGTAAQPSTGGFVQADPATNSLIITAAEPLYRQVRHMIERLDTRRAQVYIESMIVEVVGDNAADFGFQWQGLLGQSGDRFGVIAGTNFAVGGPSILSLSQSVSGSAGGSLPGPGVNIGILKNYGGTYALAAVARALQTQTNTNIVSTPNLITLDNEEAKIVVGSNVPFITGQFTTSGTAISNPFQTIERKDVGITLRIRPQIGEGGAVRMTIFQEQSSVQGTAAVGTSNAGPSTTKRSIESTVVVDDGQIIVLGGLIQDEFVDSNARVPVLSDIPGIGRLFRSDSRTKRRTNLMVFIRPVVMRDAASSNTLSLDRYEQIRAQQKDQQPAPSVVLPINDAPVLPPQRPAPDGAAAPKRP